MNRTGLTALALVAAAALAAAQARDRIATTAEALVANPLFTGNRSPKLVIEEARRAVVGIDTRIIEAVRLRIPNAAARGVADEVRLVL